MPRGAVSDTVHSRSEPGLALLSAPQRFAELDLQALTRGAAAAAAGIAAPTAAGSPPDGAARREAMLQAGSGQHPGVALEQRALAALAVDAPLVATASGCADAAALWLELSAAGPGTAVTCALPAAAALAAAGGCGPAGVAGSVRQGLAFLAAPVEVAAGQAVTLALRPVAEGTGLVAALRPPQAPDAGAAPLRSAAGETPRMTGDGDAAAAGPAKRPLRMPRPLPRHALLPSWHYPMLEDAGRAAAYDAAIRWAGGARWRRALADAQPGGWARCTTHALHHPRAALLCGRCGSAPLPTDPP